MKISGGLIRAQQEGNGETGHVERGKGEQPEEAANVHRNTTWESSFMLETNLASRPGALPANLCYI